jgi:L-amino acid N-acyltransferase YncA
MFRSYIKEKRLVKKGLSHLINMSEKEVFWTLQAGIFSVNEGSIKPHQDCGFKIVGVRKSIVKREGKWHDNVLMERRSIKVN